MDAFENQQLFYIFVALLYALIMWEIHTITTNTHNNNNKNKKTDTKIFAVLIMRTLSFCIVLFSSFTNQPTI